MAAKVHRRGNEKEERYTELQRFAEASSWVFSWILINAHMGRNYLRLEKSSQKGFKVTVLGTHIALEIVFVPTTWEENFMTCGIYGSVHKELA